MHEDAFMIAEFAELVRFDFVFLGLRIIDAALAGTGTPCPLHDLFFAKKIGGLHGVGFIGRPENHSVAKIQREHFGFVIAQRRDE
jgi:hypothetical protein